MKKNRTYKVLTHHNCTVIVGKTGKGKITSKEVLETLIQENLKDKRMITIEGLRPITIGVR